MGGALLGSGSLQGEVGQLRRAKPLCLKFHPDPPDRPFFPISICHGPWAGPTPVKSRPWKPAVPQAQERLCGWAQV